MGDVDALTAPLAEIKDKRGRVLWQRTARAWAARCAALADQVWSDTQRHTDLVTENLAHKQQVQRQAAEIEKLRADLDAMRRGRDAEASLAASHAQDVVALRRRIRYLGSVIANLAAGDVA